jgi:Cu-Zn family superoxide dismutase
MSRLSALGALAAVVMLLSFALATPMAQTAALDRITLPASVTFPEGIAYDPARGAVYTASAETGVVVRVDLKTRAAETVVPAGTLVPAGSATFPAVLGMKIDSANRLWIAGGRTRKMWVVDTRSGKVLRELQVPNPASLINDVVIVGNAAYFTDTFTPTLWRVEAHGDHIMDAVPFVEFKGTALEYGEGANVNGIAATADGTSLILVQMAKGLLFRVDVGTKAVSAIDTQGADLTGADGLVLDGRTLYVVRQTAVEIATVALSADLKTGTVVSRFKDPALAWPATAAKVDDRLIVVNTQFNARQNNTATRPFTLVGVPLGRLAAAR